MIECLDVNNNLLVCEVMNSEIAVEEVWHCNRLYNERDGTDTPHYSHTHNSPSLLASSCSPISAALNTLHEGRAELSSRFQLFMSLTGLATELVSCECAIVRCVTLTAGTQCLLQCHTSSNSTALLHTQADYCLHPDTLS